MNLRNKIEIGEKLMIFCFKKGVLADWEFGSAEAWNFSNVTHCTCSSKYPAIIVRVTETTAIHWYSTCSGVLIKFFIRMVLLYCYLKAINLGNLVFRSLKFSLAFFYWPSSGYRQDAPGQTSTTTSINLPVFFHECCFLIGYNTHYSPVVALSGLFV